MNTKRVYEPPSPDDGVRVLVDRLWPRGVRRERMRAVWMKELAPSSELRRWFGHDPDRFGLFEARYRQELLLGPGAALLELVRMAAQEKVTLLYAARDGRHNHAQALARLVEEMVAPPSKAELRRRLRTWRDGLDPGEAARRSARVREAVLGLDLWKQARGILLYLSVGREVETFPLLEEALAAGKRVFAPRVDRSSRTLEVGEVRRPAEDLVRGPFQAIPEPRVAGPAREAAPLIDLILVPGLAFDRFGNRVGYGAGYYDRLLPELNPSSPRIGLLFSEQLVPRCPTARADQPVTALACEAGVFFPWPPLS